MGAGLGTAVEAAWSGPNHSRGFAPLVGGSGESASLSSYKRDRT